jgi:hypothetical protein
VTELPVRLTAALADRYRLERELGQGGMATVYLAEDLKHHRKVAVKVLKPEIGAILGTERFLAEIRITAGDEYEWADDGWLHFTMARAGEPAMRHYRIPAGGGEARVVGDAPAGHCSPSGDVHRWVCTSNQVLFDIFVLRSTEPIR